MCGKIRRRARRPGGSRETLLVGAKPTPLRSRASTAPLEPRGDVSRGRRADMLFVEAPRTRRRISPAWWRRSAQKLPLMANMVEGGKNPRRCLPAELEAIGLCAGDLPWCDRAARLGLHGKRVPTLRSRPTARTNRIATACSTFAGINELIGTPEMIALGPAIRKLPPSLPDQKASHAPVTTLDPVTPCGAQRPPSSKSPTRWTRRSTARHSIPIIAEAHDGPVTGSIHAENRRDPGAGHIRAADLRRRHGLCGQGRDRQGRGATAALDPRRHLSLQTTPTTAARISTIFPPGASPDAGAGRVFRLDCLGRTLARHIGGNVPGNYNPKATGRAFQEGRPPSRPVKAQSAPMVIQQEHHRHPFSRTSPGVPQSNWGDLKPARSTRSRPRASAACTHSSTNMATRSSRLPSRCSRPAGPKR